MTDPYGNPIPSPPPNGNAELAALEMVDRGYDQLCNQIGAWCTLLSMIPVRQMLEIARRRMNRGILTLPANIGPAQAAEHARRLRNDERILTAAVALFETLKAIEAGQ